MQGDKVTVIMVLLEFMVTSGDVESIFCEFGIVENVGVATGIYHIAYP